MNMLSSFLLTQKARITSYANENPKKITLVVAILLLLTTGFITDWNGDGYLGGVAVELCGMVADVVIILFIHDYLNVKKATTLQIQAYQSELTILSADSSKSSQNRVGTLIRLMNLNGHRSPELFQAELENIDLRECQLGGTVTETNFIDVNLVEADFSKAKISNSNFITKNLDKSPLDPECTLLKAKFNDSHIQNTTFSHVYMHGAEFKNTKMASVNFHYCNLRHADFAGMKCTYLPKFIDVEVDKDFVLRWDNSVECSQMLSKNVNMFEVWHERGMRYFIKSST